MSRATFSYFTSNLAHASVAVLALSSAFLIYGVALRAQDDENKEPGLGNPKEVLIDYKDNPFAASTGFISIPSARALAARPRWDSANNAPSRNAATDRSISLAIVGLPVDLEHSMLQSNQVSTYCIARQSATQQSVALCGKKSAEYSLIRSSKEYNLCGFTDDCWHSTAAAILASGAAMDSRLFSFQAFAALPFKDGSYINRTAGSDDQKIEYPNVPSIYGTPGALLAALKFSPGGSPQANREESAIRNTYARLPSQAFPLAALYQNKTECCSFTESAPAFANSNVVLRTGARPGGGLYAINVFSRIDSQEICATAKRNAPCVLTDLVAQEKALQSILTSISQAKNDNARPRIGAILIIAGGPLTDKPCDQTPTARYISELRKLGVYTFVPAGNDGMPTKVRFPGCASDAVTVGSLTRDGKIGAFSNGRATQMVKLYTDGDTLVLPTRELPINGLACMLPETFTEIAKGYETILAGLGFYRGEPTGNLGAPASNAVLLFQKATQGLAQSGKFDSATLLALEARLKRAGISGDRFTRVSANVRASGIPDLAAYRQYLCKDGKQENFYQAQFIGGTLVSASVAAGQFMRLLDEHKTMSTQMVFDSLMRAVTANPVRELNVSEINSYIKPIDSPRSLLDNL